MIAESAYIAKDALELIEVDYEPLDAVTSPQQSSSPDAPLIRDEKEGQTDNHVYHWEAGDKDATDRAFARGRPRRRARHASTRAATRRRSSAAAASPTSTPRPARRRSTSPRRRRTSHRTLFAIVAGLPEQQIRIISPDLGGGFGNKVPIYPGYVVATAASLLIGRPVKWVEDRTGNLISTGFARDYHMRGELAVKDGKMTGLRATLLSDQGAFYADAQPTKFRAGLFHIVTGSYDIPAAHVVADGWYTNKAPGGVAYRCSFRVTEASYLIERLVDNAAHELGVDPTRVPARQLHPARAVPVPVRDRVRLRLRQLPRGDADRAREARLRRAAPRAGGRPARRAACSASGSRRSPRWSAPGTARSTTSPACGCSTRPSCACTRPARRSSSSASSRRARATRRRSRRSSPRSSGSRPRTSRCRRATPTTRRTGSARTRAARRRSPARRRPSSRASCATRRGRSPRTCSRRRPTTSSSRPGASS